MFNCVPLPSRLRWSGIHAVSRLTSSVPPQDSCSSIPYSRIMDRHEGILTEILLHLLVQSLFRFRSVCKFWRRIIDSSAFRKSHLQNQLKNTDRYHEDVLLLQITQRSWRHFEISMSDDDGKSCKLYFPAFQEFLSKGIGRLAVIGPVNGLICIHNWNSISSIAISNPCLGKIKILPISLISRIICRSWPTNCKIGFGFDYITGEYKVVQLTMSKERQTYVEVYSPTTNTWRKLDTYIFDDESLSLELMPINNSAYKVVSGIWAHWQTQKQIEGKLVDVILSFDMQNEVFMATVLDISKSWRMQLLGVCAKGDDSFAVFVHQLSNSVHGLSDESLIVWEGNERCWTRVGDVPDLRSFGIKPWAQALLLERDDAAISDYNPERFKIFIYVYSRIEGKFLLTPNMFYVR